ncbi:MAG TPA: hypothetical protein VFV93_12245 [Thermomicrobiales bacterium]|nr:hypothetical protein [Thermomicrobiales bacterium]
MEEQPGRTSQPAAGNLVAQVNMVPEDEPVDTGQWPATAGDGPVTAHGTIPGARSNPLQAILLGVLALVVILASMFVILQGVFEMIPS